MTINLGTLVTFFTQSSEDPSKTSATLTGILIAAASWLQQYGAVIPGVNEFFASPLGQNIDPTLTAIGLVVGGIWFLFGLFRKLTNKIGDSVAATPTLPVSVVPPVSPL